MSIGNNLALPLSFKAGRNNPKGVRAITIIKAHSKPGNDTSESWAASDIQDIREERITLTPGLVRRTITIEVMEQG